MFPALSPARATPDWQPSSLEDFASKLAGGNRPRRTRKRPPPAPQPRDHKPAAPLPPPPPPPSQQPRQHQPSHPEQDGPAAGSAQNVLSTGVESQFTWRVLSTSKSLPLLSGKTALDDALLDPAGGQGGQGGQGGISHVAQASLLGDLPGQRLPDPLPPPRPLFFADIHAMPFRSLVCGHYAR